MGFYRRFLLPRLVNLACSGKVHARQRAKVVPRAAGRVLEIGVGSGLNLPFYDGRRVERLWGLDPSLEMWSLRRTSGAELQFPVHFIAGSAETIPLAGASVDSVVVTYSLCTVPDPLAALHEIRRVLRPGGELLVCEHGRSPDASVRRWQRRLNPAWKRFGGGCHLDRAISSLLEESGFETGDLQASYIPGWKPASFNYWGAAAAR